jgi:hypothetical protein
MADPGRWDIDVRRNNAPWVVVMTVTDDAGDAIDLTGYTAAMQVRQYEGAPDPALIDLADVETEIEGIQFSDPINGELTVRIDLDTLEGLPNITQRATVLRYDLLVYDTDDVPILCLFGNFKVSTGVTR